MIETFLRMFFEQKKKGMEHFEKSIIVLLIGF